MQPYILSLVLLAGLAPGMSAAASVRSDPVRVMCYNIHHGEGLDGKLDLERIAALITEAKADVVALQEVDRGVERTNKRDLPAELARLTGLTAYFERNISHQGGEYGNAVLTRFPIKRARNTHYRMAGAAEQRGVLQLVLDVHGRDVLFMNTHLDAGSEHVERVRSAGELQRIIKDAGAMPVILCGDFNSGPGSRPYEQISAHLTDTWKVVGRGGGFTFPVKNPRKRIDYIWISPETILPLKMEVLHSIASDHLPIVAELDLK